MSSERKKLLIAAGVSFAAGIAVSLTIFALSRCPMREHRPEPFPPAENFRQAMPRPPFDAMRQRHGKPDMAHEQGRPDMKPDFHHPDRSLKDHFAEKLKLTGEQKVKIEQFRQEDIEKMAPLFKQMDELRRQADNLRKANKARFESILTPEQKEILKTMRPHNEGHPQMQAEGAPLPPPPAGKAVEKRPEGNFATPSGGDNPSPVRELPAPADAD